MDILEGLNEQQAEAVTAPPGYTQCVAGAGSGKTLTAIRKIAWEIEHGMMPWEILGMTFTKKAAREMKTRLAEFVGEDKAKAVCLDTIHAWCYKILREFPNSFKIRPNISIAEEYVDVIEELDLTFADKDELKKLSLHFSACMSTGRDIDASVIKSHDATKVFKQMREYQYEHNVFTFDDLIRLVYDKMKKNVRFREHLAQRYRLVIIDEAQDSNWIQHRIAAYLASVHKNILIVGDDAQSIYAFRNAHVEGFVDFNNEEEDSSVFRLETNYRSTGAIVSLANALIQYNKGVQIEKKLVSNGEYGRKPMLRTFFDPSFEVNHVAALIRRQGLHRGYDKIAVLCRSVRQDFARNLQAQLLRMQIPFVVVGGHSLGDTVHVKTLIAMLKLASGNDLKTDWFRVMCALPGVGKGSVRKAIPFSSHPAKFVSCFPKKSQESVVEFVKLLDAITLNIESPAICVQKFADWYTPLVELQKKAVVNKVKKIMDSMKIALVGNDVAEAVANFLLSQEEPEEGEKIKRVTISTIHQSKGLEWPVVIIPSLNDAGIPSIMSKKKKDIQEECRVFYVAVTRAEVELYLSATLQGRGRVPNTVEVDDPDDDDAEMFIHESQQARFGKLSRFLTPAVMDHIDKK